MNSSEQIQRNQSLTTLPSFLGIEIFKQSGYIVLIQGKTKISLPEQMASFLIAAIKKAEE